MSNKTPKQKKAWMRSGNNLPKKDRSARFRFILSAIAFVLVWINFAYTMVMGTTAMVDYILLAVGVGVFALVSAIYHEEKKRKRGML